jgi:hypothetical protein
MGHLFIFPSNKQKCIEENSFFTVLRMLTLNYQIYNYLLPKEILKRVVLARGGGDDDEGMLHAQVPRLNRPVSEYYMESEMVWAD